MSPDDDAPTAEAEFRDELQTLLREAHDEGIDVEGGWDCRNGPGHPDWDVVVSKVQKSEASE
ncbi:MULTISPECIES: hypothetical protein [unclassified Halorubrum]|uniref:hypothetical protein n=1 Tax=unclassified Halorubrum TaxID=2642239 RepID=UPI000B98E8D9|nr:MULTISPECIES: hypothetical protein [unclassified Halorubrum]OYR47791.1 hypothetical protein DJ81_00215 [Halorubrum sp. Hd13]OYR48671.1 hypothetical protein DJ74_10380 [Halorubrum sp. Ea8]